MSEGDKSVPGDLDLNIATISIKLGGAFDELGKAAVLAENMNTHIYSAIDDVRRARICCNNLARQRAVDIERAPHTADDTSMAASIREIQYALSQLIRQPQDEEDSNERD